MRLFTAVELPEAVRAAVAAAAASLLAPPALSRSDGVRAVAPEHLHVTVRFLGDVPPESLPPVRAALAAAAASVPSSRARVVGFGAFPSPRAPRVIWAGVEDTSGTFAALERAATGRLGPLGFPPEERPYAPHVTVARIAARTAGSGGPLNRRGRAPRNAAVQDVVTPFSPPSPSPLGPEFAARDLTLFRSDLTPRGPVYTVIERFPLAAPLP